MQDDTQNLQEKRDSLIEQHRDLDRIITRMQDESSLNRIELQRLKKQKLVLKDEIKKIENILIPDIIA